jgi:hypothetical protein
MAVKLQHCGATFRFTIAARHWNTYVWSGDFCISPAKCGPVEMRHHIVATFCNCMSDWTSSVVVATIIREDSGVVIAAKYHPLTGIAQSDRARLSERPAGH